MFLYDLKYIGVSFYENSRAAMKLGIEGLWRNPIGALSSSPLLRNRNGDIKNRKCETFLQCATARTFYKDLQSRGGPSGSLQYCLIY